MSAANPAAPPTQISVPPSLHQSLSFFHAVLVAAPGPVVVGRDRHARLPRLDVVERADLLLGRQIVAAVTGPVVDQHVRLQRAGHLDLGRAPALEVLRDVVPDRDQRAVAGEQFPNLPQQVLVVGIEVGRRPLHPAAGAGQREVWVVPVAHRVVGPERHALPTAGVGHLAGHVPLERRVGDLVVGQLRVEQAEPVVVLGGQYEVFHAGRLGQGDPVVGVEERRVEPLVEVVVHVDRRAGPARPADLLAGEADRPPVDEHAEPHGLPPRHGGGVRLHPGLVGGGRSPVQQRDRQDRRETGDGSTGYRSHGNLLFPLWLIRGPPDGVALPLLRLRPGHRTAKRNEPWMNKDGRRRRLLSIPVHLWLTFRVA